MNESKAPPDLLESAAVLIERAMQRLNTKAGRCERCGSSHFENLTEARAHERLEQMPQRLRQAAVRLREDTTAARRGAKGTSHEDRNV